MTDNAALTLETRLDDIQDAVNKLTEKVDGWAVKFVTKVEVDERDSVLKAYVDSRVGEIEVMNTNIEKLLNTMRKTFEQMVKDVTKVSDHLNVIDYTMGALGTKVEARDEMAKSNEARLTSAFGEINEIQKTITVIDKSAQKTELAVFGEKDKDGPESLYSMMSDMKVDTKRGIERIEEKLIEHSVETGKNTAMRLQIEERQRQFAERRKKIKELATASVFGTFGNPRFWQTLGGVAVAVLTYLGYGELT